MFICGWPLDKLFVLGVQPCSSNINDEYILKKKLFRRVVVRRVEGSSFLWDSAVVFGCEYVVGRQKAWLRFCACEKKFRKKKDRLSIGKRFSIDRSSSLIVSIIFSAPLHSIDRYTHGVENSADEVNDLISAKKLNNFDPYENSPSSVILRYEVTGWRELSPSVPADN